MHSNTVVEAEKASKREGEQMRRRKQQPRCSEHHITLIHFQKQSLTYQDTFHEQRNTTRKTLDRDPFIFHGFSLNGQDKTPPRDPSGKNIPSKYQYLMRRVSSRQRLVSWDAFDATADETFDFSYNDGDDLKRKRSSVTQDLDVNSEASSTATAVSAYDWELGPQNRLSLLSDDVQLKLLEFCDLPSIRNMMQVNSNYCNLIASAEARSLWRQVCQRQWHALPEDCTLVDDFHIRQHKATSTSINDNNDAINHSFLLSLAPRKNATHVDQTVFAPCRWSHTLRRFRPRSSSTMRVEIELLPNGTAVRFTGSVGIGDRCIRGDQPLARPERRMILPEEPESLLHRLSPFHHHHRRHSSDVPEQESLLHLLSPFHHHHNHHHQDDASADCSWRPFVAPFCGKDHNMHLTPRLVAYFEVSILASDDKAETPLGRFDLNDSLRQRHLPPSSECVAIGLATEDFSLHTRMPGWDRLSYGYHGDDGGLFHAKGTMIRPCGPKYGVGDTVGCGIDYVKRGIFFTYNGQFLGYAFENMKPNDLDRSLYPVVGMDTHCPVECNFGVDRPFKYDLQKMVEEYRPVVLQAIPNNV